MSVHPDGGVPLRAGYVFVRVEPHVEPPTHIAFPVAQAARLIDVDDRDNEWCEAITAEIPWEVDGDGDPMSIVADAVGSLREQRDARIDPDDPQVRERAYRALELFVGANDGAESVPIEPIADAILAALKTGAPE